MIRTKDASVHVMGLVQEMYFALGVADVAFADEGLECVITAGLDGDHNSGSLHPEGKAIDIRNEQCTREEHDRILAKLMRLERYGFDVVDEHPRATLKTTGSHFHVEYQPKPGEKFWRKQGE